LLALCPRIVDLLEVSPEGQQPVPDGELLVSQDSSLPGAASTDGSDLEGRRQIVVDDQHNLPWDVVLLHCAVRLGRVLPVTHG
jgi:hypothetical protein